MKFMSIVSYWIRSWKKKSGVVLSVVRINFRIVVG